MIRRALLAMVGLRDQPPTDEGLVFALIENGWTETAAFGAWVVALVLAAAALIVTGQVIHGWQLAPRQEAFTIAVVPVGVCLVGVIIHAIRAAVALSSGQSLALRRRQPSAYDRLVSRLTETTPWVLVPQVLIGVGFGLLAGAATVYR